MGVKNLWRLLLPCGRRLSIDTLAHQTLAIDASIWLTQISKACRDPETGRLLPNKPHVRVFLLRLMRLLYHQIRPVVVFDGVMPEVKRREIQRRRDRRERLWRDDDAGDGSSGVLKRAAKKILVKQLKELREKERAAALGVKRKRDEDNQNGDDNDGKDGTNRSQNGGAFAPGFTLPDDDDDDGDANENADDDGLQMQQSSPAIAEVNGEDDDNNIKNDDSVKEIQQYESDNDWEMSHAVQSSISDSIQQQRPGQHNNEATSNDNTAQHQSPSDDNNPFDHEHYASATDAYIASLPVETRSRWIDSQYAARRIESRRECIQAAANPDEYSSTQLRNFLKGSKLNKRVCEIGKMSKEFEERGSASDSGAAGESTVDREVGARARPALQRLRRYKNDAPDSDEDDGMFDSSGHPSNNRASMRVLFGEDDSDNSDDEGGGGFLVASPAKASSSDENERSVVELLDDDCSDDGCNAQRDNGNQVPTEEDAAPSKCEHSNGRDTHLKPPPYQINNRKRSNAPNSAAFQRSKLMELSTAGQEWEQFGTSDNNINGEELDTLIAQPVDKFTHQAKSNGVEIMDTLHTSDSDNSDNGHADSLLMLGNRYPPNQRSVGGAEPFHGIKSAGSCDDDEEDDVDWEDGDSGGCGDHAIEDDEIQNANGDARAMNDACEPFHSKEQKADPALTVIGENCDDANGLGFEQKNSNEPSIFHISNNHPWEETKKDLDDHDSSAVHHSKNENVLEVDDSSASNDENSSKGVDNEFGSFHPDRRTSDALQHAQETASKLTSWAGRAFQRAMSQHVGEQSQTIGSPGGNETGGEIIDLDSSIIEQDAKMGVIDRQHKMIDADGHSSSFPKQQQKQQYSGIELDSFDTTLDGLNKVHNSIMEEEKAMERDIGTITEEMKEDILSLLRLCGIPWIESPSEAEAQCACLEELGLVDGIVTEDSDIFVFGGKKVYKNFFDEKKFVEAYFAKEIERKLALKKYQLVALAMLLGGDYTDGVKGVGIVNGMEVLQAFPIEDSADGIQVGLQQFREWLDGFDDPYRNNDSKKAVFHKKHSSARIRWIAPSDFPSQPIMNSYLNPVVDKSKAKFSWGRPDIAGLHVFCAETLGWEKEETDRVVNPVLEVISSGSTQRRLDSYFLMKYEDDIKFATVKSKRLKAVLEDIHRDNADDNVAVEDG